MFINWLTICIKPYSFKKFADWQKTPQGQRALTGQEFTDIPGEPFNKSLPSIKANPFSITQDKTESQTLDYENQLCYR